MINTDGLKQWTCKNGHVLGIIQRDGQNGAPARRLLLLRHAIDKAAEAGMEEVDVVACIEGTTYDVRCDVPGCDQVRTWMIGEDAIERLLERVQGDRGKGAEE